MTCTHVHIGDSCVNICGEEYREARREPYGVLWCFGCRAHLPHEFVVMVPVGMSYYGPVPQLECCICKRDLTVFPGQPSQWEDA